MILNPNPAQRRVFTCQEYGCFTVYVELKNSLTAEGRYTDPVDELLLRFVD